MAEHRERRRVPAPAVLATAYAIGAVPFTNLAARLLRGVDLRDVDAGTVSGTGLYEVTGFGPLAVVGCVELAKGGIGPLLAGKRRPVLAGLAAGAAVVGHNWSPLLGFAGGRGISVGLGGITPIAPEGTAVLASGLIVGRLGGETALGCFAAIVALPAILAWRRGWPGFAIGVALSLPMLVKRLTGNAFPPADAGRRVYLYRLLFDRDTAVKAQTAVAVDACTSTAGSSASTGRSIRGRWHSPSGAR
ncbi:MAG: glycerol-3-phosphate acyltransferase [Acidimicrobiaceae bacterium]|nr:glycerol-3-phosphate acyltransferase [Acidimicrobiaceae bacterium]